MIVNHRKTPIRTSRASSAAIPAVIAVISLGVASNSGNAQNAADSGAQASQGQTTQAATKGPATRPAARGEATPAPTATGGEATSATAAGGQDGSTASATKTSGSGKPPPVCFKLTGRCVEPASARNGKSGATTGHGAAAGQKDGASAQRPLNLTAPDVRSVVPAEELQEPLPSNDQITETQEADTVQIKGEKNAPDVPGGFGALWWALNHPSQAWRIFAPAE